MHIIFIILSLAMLHYTPQEPQCIYGAVIFGLLGIMMLAANREPKKESGLKKKNRF